MSPVSHRPQLLSCMRQSPVYEIRKTAAFAIGNLVKAHRENAEKLAAAGGVVQLVATLNDLEDDELSKKVFSALANMEDVALGVILRRVARLCTRLQRSCATQSSPSAAAAGSDTGGKANRLNGAGASGSEDMDVLTSQLSACHVYDRTCLVPCPSLCTVLEYCL